jgi:soluble lytic murein transglycosylase-like protein
MRLWARMMGLAAVTAMLGMMITPSSASDIKKELTEFKKTWNDRRASTRAKYEAVRNLPFGNKGLADTYIDVLEGDVLAVARGDHAAAPGSGDGYRAAG